MSKTSESKKRRVVWGYVLGATYKELASTHKMSEKTINKILDEKRSQGFELEEFRSFFKVIKGSGLDVLDIVRNASLLSKLSELNIGIDNIATFIRLCSGLTNGTRDPKEVVSYAIRLQALQEKHGLAPEQVFQLLEKKANEYQDLCAEVGYIERMRGALQTLEQLENKKKKLQAEVAELNRERKTLENSLALYGKVHRSIFGC